MDAFWQVLAVSVVLLFVLPLRIAHLYGWLYLSGAFMSVLSVIGFGDSAGLATINAQAVPALAVALLFVVRMVIEDKTEMYLPGLLLAVIIVLSSSVVRVISPVHGIDTGDQHPEGAGHGQPPQGHTIQPDEGDFTADEDLPDPDRFDAEVDEIDDLRQ
ncbi:hypothetical protein HT576_08710 [Haloterrigena sp. SYSU A121-1]|uniref:Uncharacterized protein n=1 Tax=Haloterrigena gelatinilytica TaxID=2741724 RepID=A0A8J8GPC7_9EURY|nr:hypothetical protein [Haloterrigena gelatinilytica]NUB91100.1 hypothetical protein [Haloterrigena gelatinilytica]